MTPPFYPTGATAPEWCSFAWLLRWNVFENLHEKNKILKTVQFENGTKHFSVHISKRYDS